jgi:ZIP family zinc transporter
MIFIISIAAVLSTFLGGLFALRFHDKLHLILGFSAGAVLGVAFFDLLPESIELAEGFLSVSTTLSITALGFLGYMALDRFFHFHEHDTVDVPVSTKNARGRLQAASLSLHSFLDGAAIGLAFQVSPTVGTLVATAVLVHDFSDGINTVNVILKHNGNKAQAFFWLAIDAIAPALGMISTLFFSLDQRGLSVILSLFCGFFLYIGASDLLPESYHAHPTIWTTIMTLLGVCVLYVAITLTGA